MKASVVIPTYNKIGRLKLVVESLKYQTASTEDFEVVFVDDGSDDGTVRYLEKESFPFHCNVVVQNHMGRAHTRNTGVKNAKHDIIIFTDDDLILQRDFVKAHIEKHREREQIVHGTVYNLPRTKFFKDPIKGTFMDGLEIRDSVKKHLAEERILPAMLGTEEDFDRYIVKKSKIAALEDMIKTVLREYPGKMDWIAFVGGNVSVTKAVFEEVQGFDENFGLRWGCEDVELGYRMMKRGIPFCYCEEAANHHITHYRAGFSGEHALNTEYFYKKFHDSVILDFHKFISGEITKEEFIDTLHELNDAVELA